MTSPMTGSNGFDDRTIDALADRALGIVDVDAPELSASALPAPDGPLTIAEELELAAAAIAVVMSHEAGIEPLPNHLRSAIVRQGRSMIEPPQDALPPAPIRLGAWMGWLATAAAITLATFAWLRGPATTPLDPEQTIAERLDALRDLPGTRTSAWAAWEAEAGTGAVPYGGNVSGEVVWNEQEQRGFMVFEGLPQNDPAQTQYQLWIVAAGHGQAFPIDGGVFDVTSDGRVVVPIDPAIRATDVAAFAVTAEQPGGVVVSDQDRRVVIAPLG